MIFESYIPAYPLNQFIESFVYYKAYQTEHTLDRFLPDGYVYVVFDLSDTPKSIYDNQTLQEIQSCKKVWFSGIREKYITIPSGHDSEMFVINFKIGKAYPFVEMPMNELTDFVVDGEQVMTIKILNLRESLLECLTIRQKFSAAENYLLEAFAGKLQSNPFVDYSVNQILHNPDQISMNHIAAKVGYSQKHLIRIFKEHVGLSPKAFLKIIRFQRAIQEIDQNKFTNWSQIALQCGYFDQAHFINDFRSFSGFTPGQYLKMKSDFTNYVAIS